MRPAYLWINKIFFYFRLPFKKKKNIYFFHKTARPYFFNYIYASLKEILAIINIVCGNIG